MKHTKLLSIWLALLTLTVAFGITGCATKAHNNESLLSAAGFRTMTPTTPQQQACYTALPPYQVQRLDKNGRTVYAFADKKAGIVYVGGENEYQRYRQLGVQKQIADEQLQAAQMNQDAAMNWGAWGPWGAW
jgi:hypothetical protein